MGKRSFDRLGNGKVQKIGKTNDGQSKIYLEKTHRLTNEEVSDSANEAAIKDIERREKEIERNLAVFRENSEAFLLDTNRKLKEIINKNFSDEEGLFELGLLLSDKISDYTSEVAEIDSDNTTSVNLIDEDQFEEMTNQYRKAFISIFAAMMIYSDADWNIVTVSTDQNWMLSIALANDQNDQWLLTSFADGQNNFSDLKTISIKVFDQRYNPFLDPFDENNFESYTIDKEEDIFSVKNIRESYEILAIETKISKIESGEKDENNELDNPYDKGDYGQTINLSDAEKRMFNENTFEDPQEALTYYAELNSTLEAINHSSIEQQARENIFLLNTAEGFAPNQGHIDAANRFHNLILQRFETDPNTIEFMRSTKDHMARIIGILEEDYIIPNIEELNYDITMGFAETDEGYIYPQYIWKQNGEIINSNQIERNVRSVLSSAVRKNDPKLPPPSNRGGDGGGGGGGQLRRTTVFKEEPQFQVDISGAASSLARLDTPKLRSNVEAAGIGIEREVKQDDVLAILRQNLAELETQPIREQIPIKEQDLVTQKTKRKVFEPKPIEPIEPTLQEPSIDVSQLDKNLNEFKEAKIPRKRRKVKPIEFAKRAKTTRRSVREDAEKL